MLADCHLHFEGCLPEETVRSLAAAAGHRYEVPGVFESERARVEDKKSFLDLYKEVCGLFRAPEDYYEAAVSVAAALGRDGLAYGEVYVSPEIFRRIELPADECLAAIAAAFERGEPGQARCRILLDAVRQWGPDSASRVLDIHEDTRLPAVVGFGVGGDEGALPAEAFAGVYLRARALGLRTSVHAGEWAGPESISQALDALRPDRLDHGIAAVRDSKLLSRLAEEAVVLCVAPTSNRITGAAPKAEPHPLRRLVEAGVRVALSADDPLFFQTTTAREYRIAREEIGLDEANLRLCAENAWSAAFCPPAEKEAGLAGVGAARF
jgi:adenosine deaminase